MIKKCAFMYDDFSDKLMISRKSKDDVVIGSARFLNLTIDFTTDKRVVGVEIAGISELLKSLDIDPKILTELTEANLVFRQVREGYIIFFVLKTKNRTERVPYNLPVAKPILH